jgi:hypothetical protein
MVTVWYVYRLKGSEDLLSVMVDVLIYLNQKLDQIAEASGEQRKSAISHATQVLEEATEPASVSSGFDMVTVWYVYRLKGSEDLLSVMVDVLIIAEASGEQRKSAISHATQVLEEATELVSPAHP